MLPICDGRENGEKVIMRDKVVRWWNGEIKIRIRILEISIGRGDKRGECYKLCSKIKELI